MRWRVFPPSCEAPAMNGSIADVAGIRVGHASDPVGRTGVTVALLPPATIGSALLLGSAASTRGFESLHGRGNAKPIHGICFAGGSSFGLAATGGVQRYLRERGQGQRSGDLVIPLVPSAIIFDLHIGEPNRFPTEDMGYAASEAAATTFRQGNVGAATGALVGKLHGHECAVIGGVGTASTTIRGVTVGALAVVNAFGDVRDPRTGKIVAGARSSPMGRDYVDAVRLLREGVEPPFPSANTTLVLVATDAELTPASCDVVGRQGAAGFARTICPVFGEFDGDVLIAASCGKTGKLLHRTVLGEMAADVVAEAIVQGVLQAEGVAPHPAARDILAL